MVAAAIVGLAVVGVAAWQAGSLRVGLIVCGGFVAITLVLLAGAWVLVRLTRPLRQSSGFVAAPRRFESGSPRQSNARIVLLAVGLGCFFIVGVRAMQTNLLREFAIDLSDQAPDMFLIDIQQDQAGPVESFLSPRIAPAPPPRLLPVLRARVTAVRGREVSLERLEDVRGRGSLAREYTVTYRPALEANERIVAGRFWPDTPSSDA